MDLYGQRFSRRSLSEHTGALAQVAGVRLHTLGDGLERGIRCLEFRTGTGFVFEVMVDRGMDIGRADFRGAAIGWQSPTGFRNPSLHEFNDEGGLSFLRSFSGLLVTAGLDHALFPEAQDASPYPYPHRKTLTSPLHGRVANIPGRLTGYGERWEGDDCILWCEGVMQQAAVFGEDLHLIRRIEAKVGSSEFTLHDQVLNHGFYRSPHMFLYHINLGWPVLAAGSEYRAPVRHTIWASHADALNKQGVGYRLQSAPVANFHEQVFEHAMLADEDGRIPVALINHKFEGRGLGFMVEVNRREFPFQFQWQNYHSGHYAIGLEPSTNHVLGKRFAEERKELIWLEHGESRSYTTRFAVLDGHGEIAAFHRRIDAICAQPVDAYPPITGRWDD
jgi:hypothetical protein